MILDKIIIIIFCFAKLREQPPLKMISYPVKSSSCVEGAWPFIHAREDRTASLLFVLFRRLAFTGSLAPTIALRSQKQVNGQSPATVYFILSCARFRKSSRKPIDNCHLSRRLGFRFTNYTQKPDKKLLVCVKRENVE